MLPNPTTPVLQFRSVAHLSAACAAMAMQAMPRLPRWTEPRLANSKEGTPNRRMPCRSCHNSARHAGTCRARHFVAPPFLRFLGVPYPCKADLASTDDDGRHQSCLTPPHLAGSRFVAWQRRRKPGENIRDCRPVARCRGKQCDGDAGPPRLNRRAVGRACRGMAGVPNSPEPQTEEPHEFR